MNSDGTWVCPPAEFPLRPEAPKRLKNDFQIWHQIWTMLKSEMSKLPVVAFWIAVPGKFISQARPLSIVALHGFRASDPFFQRAFCPLKGNVYIQFFPYCTGMCSASRTCCVTVVRAVHSSVSLWISHSSGMVWIHLRPCLMRLVTVFPLAAIPLIGG